jgi:membrane protein
MDYSRLRLPRRLSAEWDCLMTRFWQLGGLTWKELARRVWHEIQVDDVFGHAAKLSFYFLLALFPLLLLLTDVFGFFAQSAELRYSLLEYFRRVLPNSAYHVVADTLNQITAGAGGGKLSLGILGTLWAASSGMVAVAAGLNAAYEIKDARPWWKIRLTAAGLTVAFSAFTVIALALVLAGGKIGRLLAEWAGYQHGFSVVWNLARWPISLFIVLLAMNLLYRFAPDLKEWEWHWMTPGAVVAVVLWIVVSLGFRFYLQVYNSYHATYGSLGAVIILMLWLYMTGAAILIGAEVNSEIENAAAHAGDPNARLAGEKSPGEKRRHLTLEWLRHHGHHAAASPHHDSDDALPGSRSGG